MDQDFYIGLIQQDLQGGLPEEGQSQLAKWRLVDPEHPVLEEQVRKSWQLSQQYAPALKLDADAAFNNLRTRVRAHEKQKTATVRKLPVARSSRRTWLAIAASALLLLAASWFLWPSVQQAGPMASIETKTGDAPREITLPDGSKIWLRENSRLDYPETFAGKSREVALTGEAFFDVTENPNAPFRIALPNNAEVEVLGTSFLVKAPKEAPLEVIVNSGKVGLNVGNKTLILFTGKAGTWDPTTGGISELNYSPNAAAWRNNTLVFDDQPLASVVRDLEAYFNVSITFANRQLLECRFGGRFPDAELVEILDAMKQTLEINWQLIDDEYLLKDGNCQ